MFALKLTESQSFAIHVDEDTVSRSTTADDSPIFLIAKAMEVPQVRTDFNPAFSIGSLSN